MQPLPPEAVAGIDQRAGQCNAMLDQLIAKYQMLAAAHGTAAAVGVMAAELTTVEIRGIGNIIDGLAFAVARLAELEESNETDCPPTV